MKYAIKCITEDKCKEVYKLLINKLLQNEGLSGPDYNRCLIWIWTERPEEIAKLVNLELVEIGL